MVVRPGSFVVLLPVKSPGTGKSRLSTLSHDDRRRLAAAFAADVVETCLATAEVGLVAVVSDDAVFADSLTTAGVVVVDDPGDGLNAALRRGAGLLRDAHPDLRPAALLADLPCLTSADLGSALAHAAALPAACFVRDADDTGTTLYTAPYDGFDPRFGVGSAAAHLAGGAAAIPGALATLRHDVDDLEGLSSALALGVGRATRSALAATHLG